MHNWRDDIQTRRCFRKGIGTEDQVENIEEVVEELDDPEGRLLGQRAHANNGQVAAQPGQPVDIPLVRQPKRPQQVRQRPVDPLGSTVRGARRRLVRVHGIEPCAVQLSRAGPGETPAVHALDLLGALQALPLALALLALGLGLLDGAARVAGPAPRRGGEGVRITGLAAEVDVPRAARGAGEGCEVHGSCLCPSLGGVVRASGVGVDDVVALC